MIKILTTDDTESYSMCRCRASAEENNSVKKIMLHSGSTLILQPEQFSCIRYRASIIETLTSLPNPDEKFVLRIYVQFIFLRSVTETRKLGIWWR